MTDRRMRAGSPGTLLADSRRRRGRTEPGAAFRLWALSDRRLWHGLGQIHRLAEPGLLDLGHRAVAFELDDRRVDRVHQRLVVETGDPGKIGRLAEGRRHDGEGLGPL